MSTKEKEYTYKDFLESEETKAAAAQRKGKAAKPAAPAVEEKANEEAETEE